MTARPLNRRSFLRAASVAGLSFSSLRGLALGQDTTARAKRPTLVVVFLRGGADGLNLVVPHAEAAYYKLRPQLAIGRPGTSGGALDLDGFFGLHPAARSLAPHFESGLAACVHAVGTASNTRSHFEEQDRWETAVDGSELETTGWLNRYLATSQGHGPVRGLALGEGLPRSMRGEVATLALRGLDDLIPRGAGGDLERTLEALGRAYGGGAESGGAGALLGREGRASLEALEQLKDVARNPPASKVEYPNTDLGRRTREVARLVKADIGLEIVELDFGGWDTHQNQGAAQGAYANNVRQYAQALEALVRDLEEHLDDVLVVTISEFGRTAAQNGTYGTDHGWASCVLALGGPLQRNASKRAGPVLGAWPGLEREQLNQGRDLAHTTDFRDVYAELLGFLGCTQIGAVLPGHEVKPLGLV